ncbi:hypothetical protein M3Y99_01625000 [Aphelenchoides fujianensis]|nr:hypothetical protein M3Y99_01625000 [Aphelenchoides fujianensis]
MPTTTPVDDSCQPPDDNSAGLTIDDGVALAGFLNAPAIAHCSECDAGVRNFYTSATSDMVSEAQGNAEIAYTFECPTTMMCACNAENVCCSPPTDAAAPTQVQIIPYCDDEGVCQMNLYMEAGTMATELSCTNGDVYTYDMQTDPATGALRPLNTNAYFNADKISCSGCVDIEDDTCTGPTEDGPAP